LHHWRYQPKRLLYDITFRYQFSRGGNDLRSPNVFPSPECRRADIREIRPWRTGRKFEVACVEEVFCLAVVGRALPNQAVPGGEVASVHSIGRERHFVTARYQPMLIKSRLGGVQRPIIGAIVDEVVNKPRG